MRYMGGKSRIAEQIAAVIDQYREPGQMVWDAFCGGLSVSVALSKKGPVLSSDANEALINLYLSVKSGWIPPTEVTREEYHAAKSLPNTDPRKALIGFGCSFGGKWFGGYASGLNGKLTYPQLAARNVQQNVNQCSTFECVDFLQTVPGVKSNTILYLDPPYKGTTGYNATGKFDYNLFVQRCVEWSKFVDVFVSEYEFPEGKMVWERSSKGTLGLDHGVPHTERLFHLSHDFS